MKETIEKIIRDDIEKIITEARAEETAAREKFAKYSFAAALAIEAERLFKSKLLKYRFENILDASDIAEAIEEERDNCLAYLTERHPLPENEMRAIMNKWKAEVYAEIYKTIGIYLSF